MVLGLRLGLPFFANYKMARRVGAIFKKKRDTSVKPVSRIWIPWVKNIAHCWAVPKHQDETKFGIKNFEHQNNSIIHVRTTELLSYYKFLQYCVYFIAFQQKMFPCYTSTCPMSTPLHFFTISGRLKPIENFDSLRWLDALPLCAYEQ
jgi:hypothetical protein